jgi:hypothetical protein
MKDSSTDNCSSSSRVRILIFFPKKAKESETQEV